MNHNKDPLDEIILEAINEGWFLRSNTDYPKGWTSSDVKAIQQKAKQQILKNYISYDDLLKLIGGDYSGVYNLPPEQEAINQYKADLRAALRNRRGQL